MQHQATPPAPGGVRFHALGQAHPKYVFLLLAVLLVGAGLSFLLSESSTRGAADGAPASSQPGAPGDAGSAHAADAAGPSSNGGSVARAVQDPNDLARYVTPGQPAPSMGEVIARLHDAGVHEGLGAFNPPGTSPPLLGLAVPEDFALPPGYVRHYQATDDGQRIEPILMFSPDYEFFDHNGQPIRIPEDRVVPPGLAPPGLPIRQIVIPPPIDPRSPPP